MGIAAVVAALQCPRPDLNYELRITNQEDYGMNRDMFSLRYGQTGRMEFRIVTETGTAPELRGALMVDGRAVRLVPSGAAALLVPVVPPGVYLMEVRCGGATVLYSELEVKPSPLPLGDEAGVVQWTVNADLTQALAVVEVHLHEGPQGERGAQGERGEQGPQGAQGPQGERGAPLTYADLTEEQKVELAKTAREAVEAHAGDTTAHVTAEERAAWNGKLTPEALTEEREAVVELYASAGEKRLFMGNYVVISGARVPGGELLRVLSTATPSNIMPDGSAVGTQVLVLEQRESAGSPWREVGRSAVQVGEEELAGVTQPGPVWEFTGCELIEGQDLRIRYENEAGAVVPCFIYSFSVDDEVCCVYDNSTSSEQPGYLPSARFYLTQNVSKYATTGELNKHTADTVAHVTAEERAAWNAAGGGMKAIQTRMDASEETYINEDGYPLAKYGEVYIPESAPTGWYCVGTMLPDVAFGWVEHKQGERTLVWRPLLAQLSTTVYAPLEVIMTVPGWYTAEVPMICV